MLRHILLGLFAASLIATRSLAAKTLDDLRQAEKISFSLTGKPLPDSLRKAFLKDEIDLSGITDKLSSSEDFIQYYAEFWSKTIGIRSPASLWKFKVSKPDNPSEKDSLAEVLTNGPRFNLDRLTNSDDGALKRSAEGILRAIEARKGQVPEIIIDPNCEDENKKPYPQLFVKRDFTDPSYAKEAKEKGTMGGRPLEGDDIENRRKAWGKLYDELLGPLDVNCRNSANVSVKPWWDPNAHTVFRFRENKGYRAHPKLVELCGGVTLPKCDMMENSGHDMYTEQASSDLAMEPSWLIAHTVAEDRPFTEILTTEDTIMSGIFGSFMGMRGMKLWEAYPNGKIADSDHKIFKSPDPNDSKHYRIKRGKPHAGILTTPAYQLVTNGHRAKANRAYEAFLCQKFVVASGSVPDPSDLREDLRQRTYCADCHRTLEPMADFFRNWPDTGEVEFRYIGGQDDKGSFNGQSGSGAAEFGRILSESEQFAQCSVKRAFEFLNGRLMTNVEDTNLVPLYVAELQKNKMNLRSVIKKMILHTPEFLHPKEGAK